MRNLLHFGIGLAFVLFSGPTVAQMYDDVSNDDTNCRAVLGQAEIDDTPQQVVGRAYLQSDGTWQIMQSPDGSVLWYPLAAYPYPDRWYWRPPLFVGAGVSFIFVDRFHRFHHFHRFDHFGDFNRMDHRRFGMPIGAGAHRGPIPIGGRRGLGGVHRFGGMSGAGGMRRH
ncbi:hypothetical protein LIG30_0510 [Burkholderia sp. lig30]|jgi:hypothetical protein|uniref:hypothetical protein n=1 Tax=Burkholderia sp. lig30 TaxID=1192124 RepID=UPI000460F991|nr:hypothetical protein [Burkholderia sp. lig30]KDB06236.1 hypothetical protein LIG30_0510 [Burkholderia sp. lig30]